MKRGILRDTGKKGGQCSLCKRVDRVYGVVGGVLRKMLGSVNPVMRFLLALKRGMNMNNATNSGTEPATWLQGDSHWRWASQAHCIYTVIQGRANIKRKKGWVCEVKQLKELNLSFTYRQPITVAYLEVNCLSSPGTQNRLLLSPTTIWSLGHIKSLCFGARHLRVKRISCHPLTDLLPSHLYLAYCPLSLGREQTPLLSDSTSISSP